MNLNISRLFRQLNQYQLASKNGFCMSSAKLQSDDPSKSKSKLDLAKPKKLSERFQKALKQKESKKDKLTEAIDTLSTLAPKKPSIKSDLLKKLREHQVNSDSKDPSTADTITTLFNNMRIEKRVTQRARGISSLHITESDKQARQPTDTKLFDGPDLGIFDPPEPDRPKMPTFYEFLKESENLKLIAMPPRNAYEEAIRWTLDGKFWNFPIDNEQGIPEEERRMGFHEHVFLNKYLQGLPDKKPIRIFMDLVLNGLAHNPYMTVAEKKENIDWYVAYFKEHSHLINEGEQT